MTGTAGLDPATQLSEGVANQRFDGVFHLNIARLQDQQRIYISYFETSLQNHTLRFLQLSQR
jgi:hypothetical protein